LIPNERQYSKTFVNWKAIDRAVTLVFQTPEVPWHFSRMSFKRNDVARFSGTRIAIKFNLAFVSTVG
jgi:hypothetical protein